jgi:hypothetical protein
VDLFKPPSVRPWEDLSEADRPGVQFLDPGAGFPVLGCLFRPRVPSSRVKWGETSFLRVPILDAANPRSGSKAILFEDDPREIVEGGFLAYRWGLLIRVFGGAVLRIFSVPISRIPTDRHIDR